MKRMFLTTTVLGGLALAGAGWAGAQTPSKAHDGHHEAAPAKPASSNGAPSDGMGKMSMGKSTMGSDKPMCPMMGGGGMGAMGAMMAMGGADTEVAVTNMDKGVTITFTATDPSKVARLQKMAEAMRLMHEATGQ